MVLIHPRIDREKSQLEVNFPAGSTCEPFVTPLDPAPEVLLGWSTCVPFFHQKTPIYLTHCLSECSDAHCDCRLSNLFHFNAHGLDGYVCQSVASGTPPDAPSASLSKFLGMPVHLVLKGPNPRFCEPTHAFPGLPALPLAEDQPTGTEEDATLVFQDGYPLLIASEDSLRAVGSITNQFALGQNLDGEIKGMSDKWKDAALEMER
jgi:uncharacterized protein